MANIKSSPFTYMPNLLHLLEPYASEDKKVVTAIVELNSHTINKYELITETGHLKLDRVGYSSLSYPFTYGAIPMTWDQDGDPLDITIVNVTEPLIPGSVVEARIIGIMKFVDGGEVDDKVVAVLNDDKRMDHIQTIEDLGEYFVKETTYYWEHYKDLKKPGTGKVEGFFDTDEAIKIIDECAQRYVDEYMPKFMEDCGCACECEECNGEECDCENCSCEDCDCEDCNCEKSEETRK
jgi:inorganic pyrophosphatase